MNWLPRWFRMRNSDQQTSTAATRRRRMLGRRPAFETLEQRRLLATYHWDEAASSLVITLQTDESLDVSYSDNAESYTFELSQGTFTPTAFSDLLAGSGGDTLYATSTDLAQSLFIRNLGTQTGTNNVEFESISSLATGSLKVILDDSGDGRGNININDATIETTDGIELDTLQSITVLNGSALSTVDGEISMTAKEPDPNYYGSISISNSDITAAGEGGISIHGTGEGGVWTYGVHIQNGALIQSASGDIEIVGVGKESSFNSVGISVGTSTIESTAGGEIRLQGTAHQATHVPSIFNHGVMLVGSTQVRSAGGRIEIEGTGGSTSHGQNFGIVVSDAYIKMMGNGEILLKGQGGTGHTENHGVQLYSAIVLSEDDGEGMVKIVGTAGMGGSAVVIDSQSQIVAPLGAPINLIADTIQIDGSYIAAENIVKLAPKTNGANIVLGKTKSAGGLSLTQNELHQIDTKRIVLGKANVKDFVFKSAIALSSSTDLQLVGQGTVSGADSLIDVALKGGRLSFNGGLTYVAVIDSASDYSTFRVGGKIDLAGLKLKLVGSYVPASGNKFNIVTAKEVLNQFVNLPKSGGIIKLNGTPLTIHYLSKKVMLKASAAPLGPQNVIALGAEAGARPMVKVLNAKTGAVIVRFLAYGAKFKGGVRVAVADLNHDGKAQIIVAPGAGRARPIKVFDLKGKELRDYRIKAYKKFPGGVFVAAGDVNGDGWDDIITSPGSGMPAEIKVFRNRIDHRSPKNPRAVQQLPMYDFMAFGWKFTGGATVAAADLNGDGRAEIIVGSGPGMSPLVRVFDMTELPIGVNTVPPLWPYAFEITPFGAKNRGGVFVAAGDVRGRGPEIIVGSGQGGRGGVQLFTKTGKQFKSFTAYGSKRAADNAPVHVAAKQANSSPVDEILTGQGSPGSTRLLRAFNANGAMVDEVFERDRDFRFGFFVA